MTNKIETRVYMSYELKQKVEDAAEDMDISFSAFVREATREYCQRFEGEDGEL